MPHGKGSKEPGARALRPLPETVQLGERVYQALVESITSGELGPGAPLRPEAIARELAVSTTPVREAMQRLESDGLAVKHPYQGWFVRGFTAQEMRDYYQLAAVLECFAVRLACERITAEELAALWRIQAGGEAAEKAGDVEAYCAYHQDLHDGIRRAARNCYLIPTMAQIRLQHKILLKKLMQIPGLAQRATQEHRRIIELIERRDAEAAARAVQQHVLSALTDFSGPDSAAPRVPPR